MIEEWNPTLNKSDIKRPLVYFQSKTTGYLAKRTTNVSHFNIHLVLPDKLDFDNPQTDPILSTFLDPQSFYMVSIFDINHFKVGTFFCV